MKYLLVILMLLPACATAGKIKTQIAGDLLAIVNGVSCENACDEVKKYVAEQLQK